VNVRREAQAKKRAADASTLAAVNTMGLIGRTRAATEREGLYPYLSEKILRT
jgi:hypothetical protein